MAITTSLHSVSLGQAPSSMERGEIGGLTSNVERLQGSTQVWNSWYLRFVFVAVVLTAATFVSQYVATKRSRELADAESLLSSAKDRALATQLKDRDVQISDLNRESDSLRLAVADANARAASAEALVASANAASKSAVAKVSEAEARIAEAQRGAAEASAKAEQFRLDIAQANERAASANLTAEKERIARLQLEARLADRILTSGQQTEMTERLRPLAGTVVDVMTWGDTSEVQMISSLILSSLAKAGWIVQPAQAVGGGAAVRGILVGIRADANENTIRASRALISALQAAGLDAGPWAFDQLQSPGATMNRGYKGDAPIRMFIGSKL